MAHRMRLIEGFDRLLKYYGPRKWWPAESPFEVMIGAILTQNTNWKNVEQAIERIRGAGLMVPHLLHGCAPDYLAELIKPAGYFRVKTVRLKNFLKYFIDSYGGDIERMKRASLEKLREELLAVSGIGPETADSILLYALEKPIFVIDSYTKRILSRHALCAEDDCYDDLQAIFMDRLDSDVKLFNEYHALIVECCKEFCRKVQLCEGCPLKGWNDEQ